MVCLRYIHCCCCSVLKSHQNVMFNTIYLSDAGFMLIFFLRACQCLPTVHLSAKSYKSLSRCCSYCFCSFDSSNPSFFRVADNENFLYSYLNLSKKRNDTIYKMNQTKEKLISYWEANATRNKFIKCDQLKTSTQTHFEISIVLWVVMCTKKRLSVFFNDFT